MASDEERDRHSKRRKRNVMAKIMYENKGAFAIKAIDPRRPEYHREKLRVTDIYEDTDES